VRHLDHPIRSSTDGSTSRANGQGLCEARNYAKEAPGWQARPSPTGDGHEIVTTLPTDHRYRSRPPPVVSTIGRTPIRLDYVLVDHGHIRPTSHAAIA
jgi:hypothetical protein